MANEVKITKTMWFEAIKEVVEASDVENKEDMVAFLDAQISSLAARAEKAKERAEKAKVEGDALRETVLGYVTTELQTIDTIVAAIGDEEITKAKVTARLTQLAKAGLVVKEQIKVDDRKVMAYKLAD